MRCPQCSAQLEYSPVDDADWCWSCGSLFYRFVPDSTLPRRQTRRSLGNRKYSLVPERIRELFIKAGGKMYVRDLSDQMHSLYSTHERQVRLTLTSHAEFSPVGLGWWVLDTDFEI